jgi:hypothetical protein
MKLRRCLAALALFAAMATSGTASAQTTLRIGLAEDPDILDPTLARTDKDVDPRVTPGTARKGQPSGGAGGEANDDRT